MTEQNLRLDAQTRLRSIRQEMLSVDYFRKVEKLSAEEQANSAQKLVDVHQTYLRLRTANLKSIRSKLNEESDAVQDGINRVDDVLEDLEDVVAFLGIVDSFLGTVGRVLKII